MEKGKAGFLNLNFFLLLFSSEGESLRRCLDEPFHETYVSWMESLWNARFKTSWVRSIVSWSYLPFSFVVKENVEKGGRGGGESEGPRVVEETDDHSFLSPRVASRNSEKGGSIATFSLRRGTQSSTRTSFSIWNLEVDVRTRRTSTVASEWRERQQ